MDRNKDIGGFQDCQRFDNWYLNAEDGNCYKQFRQGPCQFGELFYLDPETGATSCQCRPSWIQHFYPADSKCYEHSSVGPCPDGMYFSFNETTQTTGCTCFTNYLPDAERDICVEKLTQANCPLGQLATPDPTSGDFKCDCQSDMKEHFWQQDGNCYQHFTTGPCQAPEIFRIDDSTGLPACMLPFSQQQQRQKRYLM